MDSWRLGVAWAIGLALLSGCAPAPTPFPVTPIVSPTPLTDGVAAPVAQPAQASQPLRYGVLPNAASSAPLGFLATDGTQVEVVQDIATLDTYDIVIGYGRYDDWQPVPVALAPVRAVMMPYAPLDNPRVMGVLAAALDVPLMLQTLNISGTEALYRPATPTDPAALRAELANAGYPEGIVLYANLAPLVGVDLLGEQLATANIHIRPTDAPPAQLHLSIGQFAPLNDERIAPLDLYTLPISYRASEGVIVTFTADGWAIAARP